MADEVLEEVASPAQSPLVQVAFQKDPDRKQKYLEAEPKILGVTQIGLSTYQIINVAVFLANDLSHPSIDIPFFVASLLVVIAGSVAVAAQNLHVPTLRACLAMQIVACVASVCNMICMLIKMDGFFYCWHYDYENSTQLMGELCHKLEASQSHMSAEGVVVEITLLAISATLAAYCCKVINCCAPAPRMPVIILQAPPAQQ